jgi:hypothetical protein
LNAEARARARPSATYPPDLLADTMENVGVSVSRIRMLAILLVGAELGCPDPGGGDGGTASTSTTTTTSTGQITSEVDVTGVDTTAADTVVDTTAGDTAGTGGAGGGECATDQQCGPGEQCFDAPDHGECACTPGLVLCGDACVDVRSDPVHCGRCNFSCAGLGCQTGVCGGFVDPGTNVIEPPVLISGGNPAVDCIQVNEGKPERSINWAPGAVSAYVGLQTGPDAPTSGHTVVADETGVWGAGFREVPFDPMPLTRLGGDPWTTTHGGLGLELVSFIGEIDTPTGARQSQQRRRRTSQATSGRRMPTVRGRWPRTCVSTGLRCRRI